MMHGLMSSSFLPEKNRMVGSTPHAELAVVLVDDAGGDDDSKPPFQWQQQPFHIRSLIEWIA